MSNSMSDLLASDLLASDIILPELCPIITGYLSTRDRLMSGIWPVEWVTDADVDGEEIDEAVTNLCKMEEKQSLQRIKFIYESLSGFNRKITAESLGIMICTASDCNRIDVLEFMLQLVTDSSDLYDVVHATKSREIYEMCLNRITEINTVAVKAAKQKILWLNCPILTELGDPFSLEFILKLNRLSEAVKACETIVNDIYHPLTIDDISYMNSNVK
jgi:hypothetical protein